MTSFIRHARAKVNLTLDVGPRRPDGYHEIRSIMQTIALHDTLTITRLPDSPQIRLEVRGEESEGVPSDESNLVHRAAVRLQKTAAAREPQFRRFGMHILLHKRIPSQAGLGGGSSDAAAALTAVNDLFGLQLSEERLAVIGAALGADVPFFLRGGTALAEGIGERLTSLPDLAPPWPLVVVKPPSGISTAAAYAALDADSERIFSQATAAWLQGSQTLGNDFQTVILPQHREIAAAYQTLDWTAETDKSFKPHLCGSGSALFRRCHTLEEAERLAERIRELGVGKVWVTQTAAANMTR